MKKTICFMTAIAIALVSAVSVFAQGGINSNEKAILDELKKPVKIGSSTFQFDAKDINQAENYLNTIDVTDEQKSIVMGEIESAKTIIADSGITDFNQATAALKNQILDCAVKAASAVGVKLVYNSASKIITMTDREGNIIYTGENPIKFTGAGSADFSGLAIFAGLFAAVIGTAAVITVKSKKAVR